MLYESLGGIGCLDRVVQGNPASDARNVDKRAMSRRILPFWHDKVYILGNEIRMYGTILLRLGPVVSTNDRPVRDLLGPALVSCKEGFGLSSPLGDMICPGECREECKKKRLSHGSRLHSGR
jgi:hypothetical protein